MNDDSRAIPFYVIQDAYENRTKNDNFAVIRSDNDWNYAQTLDEANQLKQDMQSAIDHVSPVPHTVAVVELTSADEPN